MGGASSTEMGQLFPPLAASFPPPPLLQQRPADTESSISPRRPADTESSISPRRPADTESSILPRRPADAPLHHQPHRYRHWPISIYYVLNCQLRAMRKKHTRPFRALRPFRAHPVCVWNGGLTESTAGVHYLHRVLD